jgi:hypothetical protein
MDLYKLFNDSTTYSRSVLPGLATEARDLLKSALTEQFKEMPASLSPTAFVGDYWTDKYRQTEFTSTTVSFVDRDFKFQTFDLCVSEYEAASKYASNIRADLIVKLAMYVDPQLIRKPTGKFVFVSDSDAKLVAALREDFDSHV